MKREKLKLNEQSYEYIENAYLETHEDGSLRISLDFKETVSGEDRALCMKFIEKSIIESVLGGKFNGK